MLKNKTRKDTQIKLYKVIAAPMLIHGSVNEAIKDLRGGRLKQQT
jgi:hypothetical protein